MSEGKKPLIETLIAESGEMWASTKDRNDPLNYVIVCEHPNSGSRAWMDKVSGKWVTQIHQWTADESADFFSKFGSEGWAYLLGAVLPHGVVIRGFVYNGRNPGWATSTAVIPPEEK